jgi:succinoglycan biosynthesis protein ExoM
MTHVKTDNTKLDHISVCVCTFKRPAMLERLLDGLLKQATDKAFTYEIVIVDNDSLHSAEDLVRKYEDVGPSRVIYDCEPEQSISLARNRSIHNASGNFIAIMDDDEFPAVDWLLRIYRCIKDTNADGVLGPVLPDFPAGAPSWLKKSGLCDRPRNPSGSIITGGLRTGNVIFRRNVFEKNDRWFDPARGLTGGSDGEFMSRQIKGGFKFVWCDEAIVFETVLEERWPASFYLNRQFRIGTLAGNKHRKNKILYILLKNIMLLLGYCALLPLSLFLGKSILIKVLTKIYYNAGYVLSFFAITRVQQRQ